jgi:hypothetical protein
MSNNPLEFKKLFPQKHVVAVLTAIVSASPHIKKKSRQEHEDRITERLHNRLIMLYPFRDGPLTVDLQTQIPVTAPNVDPRPGIIDLKVPSRHGYQVYFAIEAKRLRVVYAGGRIETLNDKYFKDGMMRFITGRYAPFMETGAMIGYVFDGQVNKARDGIGNYIQKKKEKLKLRTPEKLIQSDIVPDAPIFQTLHGLGERDFTIYHLFIAV